MDRDGKTISQKLNDTKTRIQEELGKNSVWVTKGREIENYLSGKSVQKWLLNSHNIHSAVEMDSNRKLEDIILTQTELLKYNRNKNKYATEIVDHIEITDLDVLDLKVNIQRLITEIKKWNKI